MVGSNVYLAVMIRRKAYKIRLKPTDAQIKLFYQYAGCRRFVYNKLLDLQINNLIKSGKTISRFGMCYFLPKWKLEHEFLKDAPAQAMENVCADLSAAFDKFWKTPFDRDALAPALIAVRDGAPRKEFKAVLKAFPRFKSRHKSDTAFKFRQNVSIDLDSKTLKLPKIHSSAGLVRIIPGRYTVIPGRIKNTTISCNRIGQWFAALQVEYEVEPAVHPHIDQVVGIDVGVVRSATLYDGKQYTVYQLPEKIKRLEARKEMLQVHLSKKQGPLKGKQSASNKWRKLLRKINKIEVRIVNIRQYYQHSTTTAICRNYGVVAVEDLKIKNMSRSAKGTVEEPGRKVAQKAGLNRSILRESWGEFKRQIEYKADWQGGTMVKIPPYNTSCKCPVCSHTEKANRPGKPQHYFKCLSCGHEANADNVAAKNIRASALAGISPVTAPSAGEVCTHTQIETKSSRGKGARANPKRSVVSTCAWV